MQLVTRLDVLRVYSCRLLSGSRHFREVIENTLRVAVRRTRVRVIQIYILCTVDYLRGSTSCFLWFVLRFILAVLNLYIVMLGYRALRTVSARGPCRMCVARVSHCALWSLHASPERRTEP